jgi:DNA-binding MarR family transcriptional regulator
MTADQPVRRSTELLSDGNNSDANNSASEVDDLVTALLTASRVLVGVSARSLAQIEDTVTVTQFRTLVVLGNSGSMNLNRLAELLGVTASTAMRMIDRLSAAELVNRRENRTNRREVVLSLTEPAEQLVRQVTSARRQAITQVVAAMPAERRTELITALRAFADAAGEAESRPELLASLGW